MCPFLGGGFFMSNKLNRSIEKIDKIFDKMYDQNIRVNKKKNNISLRTKKNYSDRVKTFLREVNKEFGISDISKVKQKHYDYIIDKKICNYRGGKTSEVSNIKTTLAALNHFNWGIQETNIYSNSKKFTIGDIKETRKMLRGEKIYRKSGYSNVMQANPEQSREVLGNIPNLGYDTVIRKLAGQTGFISLKTGGRITSVLGLKKRDFQRTGPDGGKITFFRDKGGLTRTVKVDNEIISYLEDLSSEKKSGNYLFEVRKKDNRLKSREQIRQQVSKVISAAGASFERVEIVKSKDKDGNEVAKEVIKKFTTHSFRKAFALERTKDYYLTMSTQEKRQRLLEKRFRENPKVEGKYYRQLDRINSKRNVSREMTREEVSIFLTSVDLGHFRTDVINMYYCNFGDVKRYYKI